MNIIFADPPPVLKTVLDAYEDDLDANAIGIYCTYPHMARLMFAQASGRTLPSIVVLSIWIKHQPQLLINSAGTPGLETFGERKYCKRFVDLLHDRIGLALVGDAHAEASALESDLSSRVIVGVI